MHPSLVAAVLSAGLTAAALPAHAGYVLRDISNGGRFQSAYDINNRGEVVGATIGLAGWDSYFYSASTGVLSLETRPPAGSVGPLQSIATDINDGGQVAGLWVRGTGTRVFSKDPGRAMLDLNIPNPGVGLAVSDIDAQGRVVGVIDHGGDPANNQVFLSTPRVGETVISPVGGVTSVAGLLPDGRIVGDRHVPDASPYAGARAGLLDEGTWTDLPMPARATASYARGFNDTGVIVGAVETPYVELKTWLTSAGAWVDGRYVDIGGRIALNEWSSESIAVNDPGLVIGSGVLTPEGVGRFNFLYDLASGSFTDLAAVLDPVSAAGWTDLQLRDINNVGQIVGSGRFQGEVRAFLLAPTPPVPEPATALMLALGAGMLTVARVRRPTARRSTDARR